MKHKVDNHQDILTNLKSDVHHINIKVDAVLIKNGLDPAKILKERDGEDSR